MSDALQDAGSSVEVFHEEPRAAADPGSKRLRMKDLCARTGLSRQAVHYYIREGLLPPGEKTSRNMAWYAESHVERIQLIRRLQHERFLPLSAIKALLDEREERFDDSQRGFLREVRARLRMDEARETPAVSGASLVAEGRIPAEDLEDLADANLVGVGRGEDGRVRVSGEAVPILDVLGRLRALGFSRESGFSAEDILVYERAVSALLREEAGLIARGLSSFPPEEAADRVAQALPLVHELISHLHRVRIEEYLDGI